ncbi:MAG: transposase [Desulfovibrio sp.]|nr:transposase [Desulfovibrio sp.]
MARQWKRYPDVQKLQSLRGIAFLFAVGIVAKLGGLRRFKSARQLMACAGLVPPNVWAGSGQRPMRGRGTSATNTLSCGTPSAHNRVINRRPGDPPSPFCNTKPFPGRRTPGTHLRKEKVKSCR